MNLNKYSYFKVNMKEIDADKDILSQRLLYDPSKPEKTYSLNFAETYHHIVL